MRFPIYFLADCSKLAVEESSRALRQLHSKLMADPAAVEMVWLSVICFGETAGQLMPLQDLIDFAIPELPAFHSEQRRVGEAIVLLKNCIRYEVQELTKTPKGDYEVRLPTNAANTDYPPLVFVCVGGTVAEISEGKTSVQGFREDAPNARIEIICDRAACVDELTKSMGTISDSYAAVRDYFSECMEDTYFIEIEPILNARLPPPPSGFIVIP